MYRDYQLSFSWRGNIETASNVSSAPTCTTFVGDELLPSHPIIYPPAPQDFTDDDKFGLNYEAVWGTSRLIETALFASAFPDMPVFQSCTVSSLPPVGMAPIVIWATAAFLTETSTSTENTQASATPNQIPHSNEVIIPDATSTENTQASAAPDPTLHSNEPIIPDTTSIGNPSPINDPTGTTPSGEDPLFPMTSTTPAPTIRPVTDSPKSSRIGQQPQISEPQAGEIIPSQAVGQPVRSDPTLNPDLSSSNSVSITRQNPNIPPLTSTIQTPLTRPAVPPVITLGQQTITPNSQGQFIATNKKISQLTTVTMGASEYVLSVKNNPTEERSGGVGVSSIGISPTDATQTLVVISSKTNKPTVATAWNATGSVSILSQNGTAVATIWTQPMNKAASFPISSTAFCACVFLLCTITTLVL